MPHNNNLMAPSIEYVKEELVKLLYQHAWFMSLLVGLSATGLTAYMFLDSVDGVLIASWLLFINTIIIGRVSLILIFLFRQPPRDQYVKWGNCYLIFAWVNGIAWGLPALFLDSQNFILIFFYATVIGGFVAGAIPGLSFNIKAFYGFSIFSTAPLIAVLFMEGQKYFTILAVLSLLFLWINIASSKIYHRRVKKQIELEYENHQLVEQLREEKERAEQASVVKTQFLAAASHDLRQPLHALGLFIDALDNQVQLPNMRKLIDNIKLSTQSLKSLLNGLLDMSRLEASVMKPDVSVFSLNAIFEQLNLECDGSAQSKGLDLRIRACNYWVRSDIVMVTQILRNVITNAIRYTKTGSVLLACRRRGDVIRVEVHDTGIGMSPAELKQVFEEFYQVGNLGRDKRYGLGLGLAIVKRIARLLEHEVSLDSTSKKGTTFCLSLPEADSEKINISNEDDYKADVANKIVLVIDDEESVREGMREVLNMWSCNVIMADSAKSALELLSSHGELPDIIIADYRLAKGELGVAAIEKIQTELNAVIPAIIVTGDTAPERLREATTSGYHLLHKPIAPAKLRSLMSYLLNLGESE